MARLLLVRGLPGSGKSTYAKSQPGVHLEADMYFINDKGEYIFDRNKLHEAHKWCQRRAKELLDSGKDVVVANTFTTLKELRPYIEWTEHEIVIHDCVGEYQNIHNVPEKTLKRMKARWISKDKLFIK